MVVTKGKPFVLPQEKVTRRSAMKMLFCKEYLSQNISGRTLYLNHLD
jgi:hypothetical protein